MSPAPNQLPGPIAPRVPLSDEQRALITNEVLRIAHAIVGSSRRPQNFVGGDLALIAAELIAAARAADASQDALVNEGLQDRF